MHSFQLQKVSLDLVAFGCLVAIEFPAENATTFSWDPFNQFRVLTVSSAGNLTLLDMHEPTSLGTPYRRASVTTHVIIMHVIISMWYGPVVFLWAIFTYILGFSPTGDMAIQYSGFLFEGRLHIDSPLPRLTRPRKTPISWRWYPLSLPQKPQPLLPTMARFPFLYPFPPPKPSLYSLFLSFLHFHPFIAFLVFLSFLLSHSFVAFPAFSLPILFSFSFSMPLLIFLSPDKISQIPFKTSDTLLARHMPVIEQRKAAYNKPLTLTEAEYVDFPQP